MFEPIIDHAKLQISTTVSRYSGQAVMAILVAIGAFFAVLAVYFILEREFGSVVASAIMCGVFLGLALIVALYVAARQKSNDRELRQSARQLSVVTNLAAISPVAVTGGRRLAQMVGWRASALILAAIAASILANRSASGSMDDSGGSRGRRSRG